MKKYILIAILVLPLSTQAAWWNFWVDEPAQTITSITTPTPLVTIEPTTIPIISTTVEPSPQVIEKPIYKDRVVTNIVKVDNPALTKQIQDLKLQVATLTLQLNTLQDKYNKVQKNYSDLQEANLSVNSKVNDLCSTAKLTYSDFINQERELPKKYEPLFLEHSDAKSMVQMNMDKELKSIKSNQTKAMADVNIYCK